MCLIKKKKQDKIFQKFIYLYNLYLDIMSNNQSFRQTIVENFHKDPNISTNILSEIKGNRFYITFNRPKRYNAFTPDMYYTFTHLINAAN